MQTTNITHSRCSKLRVVPVKGAITKIEGGKPESDSLAIVQSNPRPHFKKHNLLRKDSNRALTFSFRPAAYYTWSPIETSEVKLAPEELTQSQNLLVPALAERIVIHGNTSTDNKEPVVAHTSRPGNDHAVYSTSIYLNPRYNYGRATLSSIDPSFKHITQLVHVSEPSSGLTN